MSQLGLSAQVPRVRPQGGRAYFPLLRVLPYALFLVPPLLFSSQIDIWVNPLLIGIAGAVGLNVLTGTTGLISLGQAGFLAVGAYTSVAISISAGMSFPVAMVASIGSGMIVGAIVGLSTARLRGLYAVISTLALQAVVVYIGTQYQNQVNFTAAFLLPTASFGGLRISTGDRWYVLLALLAALYLAVYQRLLRTSVGRALEVIGERDHVAPMLGINVARYELYTWMLSGGAVALVGCLQAYYLSAVSPDGFTLTIAIQYFAMIVIGGRGSPFGSVLGAAVIITLPFELQALASRIGGPAAAANSADYEQIVYGVLLIVFLVVAPDGLVGRLKALSALAVGRIGKTLGNGRVSANGPPPGSLVASAVSTRGYRAEGPVEASTSEVERSMTALREGASSSAGANLLAVEHLTVGYRGGSVALRDVSIEVASGEVVAVLGPNGAGKTSLLRAIAGFAPDEPGILRRGAVLFEGRSVNNVSAYRRATSGIVLVPEREKVFPTLSVAENLELAGPSRKGARSASEEVLTLFPALRPKLHVKAILLSGGERQMLAIARGFMLKPRLLLLDETTLGLAPIIAEQVMEHIGFVARESSTSVLFVEQNVALAEAVADRYYALEKGEVTDAGRITGDASQLSLVRGYFGVASDR